MVGENLLHDVVSAACQDRIARNVYERASTPQLRVVGGGFQEGRRIIGVDIPDLYSQRWEDCAVALSHRHVVSCLMAGDVILMSPECILLRGTESYRTPAHCRKPPRPSHCKTFTGPSIAMSGIRVSDPSWRGGAITVARQVRLTLVCIGSSSDGFWCPN